MTGPGKNDRNLLIGVLALQMGFISREELVAGLVAWSADSGKSVGTVLIERRSLRPEDLPTVLEAVDRLIQRHQEDPSRLVDSLGYDLVETIQGALRTVVDSELQADLTRWAVQRDPTSGPDRDATTAWSPYDRDARSAWVDPVGPTPGRFEKRDLHAKGGLGQVFIAWDHELGREVALKEIQPAYVNRRRARDRFLREAEINANLEHPNIVPVHGRGTSPEGVPYYAMRFVVGETLQEALDRFHRTAKKRGASSWWRVAIRPLLRSVVDVCQAIHYAHSRDVLHRDLKPANVLLAKFGETLIIDWGLAKVRDHAELPPDDESAAGSVSGSMIAEDPLILMGSAAGTMPTEAGEMLGSPPYMSPEQALGRHNELGPATDIYSLGATLYTVLVGQQAFRGKDRAEVQAQVIRGEYKQASAVNPRVPKALEAVCRKAMALRPEDRYPTASALAEDIERWLADEPVSVHKDPFSTRALRWARHHRSLVAALIALAATVTTALAIANHFEREQNIMVKTERDKAVLARNLASKSAQLGLEVVDQLVTLGDRQLIGKVPADQRQKFLRQAVSFIESYRAFGPERPDTLIQTALVARRLANLYRLTGQLGQAWPLYEQDLAICEDLVSLDPSSARYRNLLAEALLEQGEAHALVGDRDEAEREARRALELGRQDLGTPNGRGRAERCVARALKQQAALTLARGGAVEAADLAGEAIRTLGPLALSERSGLREKVAAGETLPLIDQFILVSTQVLRANAFKATGLEEEAEDKLREAFGLIDGVAGQLEGLKIGDLAFQRSRVVVALGRLLADTGPAGNFLWRLDEAVTTLDELAQGGLPSHRQAAAEAHLVRARAREQAEDHDGAESDLSNARKALEEGLQDRNRTPDLHMLLAEALEGLARLALASDPPRVEEAQDLRSLARSELGAALEISPETPGLRERFESLSESTEPGPTQRD
jgi:serine/threonine-protein kinase